MAFTMPIIYAKETSKDDDENNTKGHRFKFNFIADVVEKVLPSIVHIEIKHNTIYGPMTASSGSGFIVSNDGYILTNAHVVRNFNHDILVKLNDSRSFKARLIKLDKSADLAILKIEGVRLLNRFLI